MNTTQRLKNWLIDKLGGYTEGEYLSYGHRCAMRALEDDSIEKERDLGMQAAESFRKAWTAEYLAQERAHGVVVEVGT